MKSTGIVRTLDGLGRVVIPIEIRRTLNWKLKNKIEIFIDEDCVILRKFRSGCNICYNADSNNLLYLNGFTICHDCLDKLNKIENNANEN